MSAALVGVDCIAVAPTNAASAPRESALQTERHRRLCRGAFIEFPPDTTGPLYGAGPEAARRHLSVECQRRTRQHEAEQGRLRHAMGCTKVNRVELAAT